MAFTLDRGAASGTDWEKVPADTAKGGPIGIPEPKTRGLRVFGSNLNRADRA